MKAKLLALLCVAAAVYSISFIPQYILGKIPQTEYTYPVIQSYQEKISVSGKLSCFTKKESYLASPVIPSKVYVSVGDKVEKNQILAEIDLEQTRQTLENSINITQTLGSIKQEDLTDLASLMESYGLSENGVLQALAQQQSQIMMVQDTQEAVIPKYIVSPISGTVTQMNLQEGVLASQSSLPAAVVADTSQYKAVVEISEADIAKVSQGDKVIITGSGFPGKSYDGTVWRIHPSAQQGNSLTGNAPVSVTAEILLENPDDSLKDGFSIAAEILIGEEKRVMSLPYEAIGQDSSNQEYVYVFSSGRAVKKEITTGTEMTYATQVDGLQEDDKVILSPPPHMTDGGRVLLTQCVPVELEEPEEQ